MSDTSQDRISIHSEDSSNSISNGGSNSNNSNSKRITKSDMSVIVGGVNSGIVDDDSVSKNEKEMKMLSFVNPGKFLDDFDPERSSRELRKMQRKLKPSSSYYTSAKPNNSVYDETGRIRESGIDICDCLDLDCPGCHFPCAKCASEKCSTECRCNRKWHFDNIYVEGTEIHIRMPVK